MLASLVNRTDLLDGDLKVVVVVLSNFFDFEEF